MQVIVEGWRSSSSDWLKAQQLSPEELPPLSPEQKDVAEKLGISEEDYARSTKAGELSRQELQAKAEAFGTFLESRLRKRVADASIQSVLLQTFDGRVRIAGTAAGREFRLQIDEELVDNLMQSGSSELEERLQRIIDLGVPAPEAKAS